jgi:hypothetical protein
MRNMSLRLNYIALARKDVALLAPQLFGLTVGAAANTLVTEEHLLLLAAASNLVDCVDNPNPDTATTIKEEQAAFQAYIDARSMQS